MTKPKVKDVWPLTEPSKVGRPKTEIDYLTVRRLAQVQCTQEMIASALGIGLRTLERDEEFRRVYFEAKEDGKAAILAMQYKVALNGNADMLKWLGKQHMRQADKVDSTIDERVTIVISNDDKDV